MKKNKIPRSRHVVFFLIVLLMLKTMRITILWPIPLIFFSFFAVMATIIYGLSNNMFQHDRKWNTAIGVYIFVSLIYILTFPSFNVFSIISLIFETIVILSVLLLKEPFKKELFFWFSKTISFILALSIPVWILYLLGMDIPHGPVVDLKDGYHFLYNHGFFVTRVDDTSLYPRFCSVFLEPGWVGTICCFIVLGLKLNLKKIETWLCLIAIFLSFSLSAVANFIICVFLWVIINSHRKILYLLLFLFLLSSITIFSISYNGGDNAINNLIVERLIFDEDLGIAGNNRTNDAFNIELEKTMNSSEKWFGIRHKQTIDFNLKNEWYSSSSGIKKDLIDNGIVGLVAFVVFLLSIFKRYLDARCFVYLICLLLAAFARNLWRSDCYLILYIVSLSTLYATKADTKYATKSNEKCLKH